MDSRQREVLISATFKGVLAVREGGMIIETPYCRYPVTGDNLDRYLGDKVEIHGLLADEAGRHRVMQVDSCRLI